MTLDEANLLALNLCPLEDHSDTWFLYRFPHLCICGFIHTYMYKIKVLHPLCQQIWKTQEWSQDWLRSVFIPMSKKGNVKECSNYHTIALISHARKIMLKILQTRL